MRSAPRLRLRCAAFSFVFCSALVVPDCCCAIPGGGFQTSSIATLLGCFCFEKPETSDASVLPRQDSIAASVPPLGRRCGPADFQLTVDCRPLACPEFQRSRPPATTKQQRTSRPHTGAICRELPFFPAPFRKFLGISSLGAIFISRRQQRRTLLSAPRAPTICSRRCDGTVSPRATPAINSPALHLLPSQPKHCGRRFGSP
jgi:hypothetical protein